MQAKVETTTSRLTPHLNGIRKIMAARRLYNDKLLYQYAKYSRLHERMHEAAQKKTDLDPALKKELGEEMLKLPDFFNGHIGGEAESAVQAIIDSFDPTRIMPNAPQTEQDMHSAVVQAIAGALVAQEKPQRTAATEPVASVKLAMTRCAEAFLGAEADSKRQKTRS